MMMPVSFSANRQKGFSLIEALVAFLILSIGMLGIGSLQLISLKAGHTAAFRTVAVIKVEEMFERIRNNPTEVLNYGTAVATDNACNDYGGLNECTSADLVAYDVFEWEKGLVDSLSANAGVTTQIDVAAPVPGVQPLAVVTVTVNWQERNTETQTMDTMSYSASADICTTTAC
jgi:type IV pilus assembly protein PilV